MRVLFLDMDGVILAGRHWDQNPQEHIPQDTVLLLNEICRQTEALVVVSSTWRHDNQFKEQFQAAGFQHQFHLDWRTKDLSDINVTRGDEIADWLARNSVESFCILDDDEDMLKEQEPFFIRTEFATGLCQEHVNQVISILMGK